MNDQFNYELSILHYNYNRNYYDTFIDHEFIQKDFYTSLKFIGATKNRDEAIILAICTHIRKCSRE